MFAGECSRDKCLMQVNFDLFDNAHMKLRCIVWWNITSALNVMSQNSHNANTKRNNLPKAPEWVLQLHLAVKGKWHAFI